MMAINKNHEFEELEGVKCAIVEKNVSKARAAFLQQLLELNKYTVIVVAAAPPRAPAAKPAPAASPSADTINAAATPTGSPAIEPAPPPAQFTVGVTDVTFNSVNAVFGRLLKTPDGHVVTLAYWQQKETVSRDDIPYYVK